MSTNKWRAKKNIFFPNSHIWSTVFPWGPFFSPASSVLQGQPPPNHLKCERSHNRNVFTQPILWRIIETAINCHKKV
mgnify:CR=1 FL=1